MDEIRPLDNFPAIRSRSPEEAEILVNRIFGARRFAVVGDQSKFFVHANFKPLNAISVGYTAYGTDVELEFDETDYAVQLFRIGGSAFVRPGPSASEVEIASSFVLPAFATFKVRFSESYQQCLLRVDHAAATARLTALLGNASSRSLEFYPEEPPAQGLSVLRSLIAALDEALKSFEKYGSESPVIRELEQVIVTSYLYNSSNNFSDLLRRPEREAASWQVRAVEDYIASHWDQPIDMDQLVHITGASSRSIFAAFSRTRGYTPMAFLKRTRLVHAHEKLKTAEPGVSVTAIALACGFQTLGHFARDYRELYGELPSETLSKQRPMPRR